MNYKRSSTYDFQVADESWRALWSTPTAIEFEESWESHIFSIARKGKEKTWDSHIVATARIGEDSEWHITEGREALCKHWGEAVASQLEAFFNENGSPTSKEST